MSFCYKKILGVFTHLRVTTPNIIEPQKLKNLLSQRLFNDGWLLLEKFPMNVPIASIFGFFQCLHSTEANRMIG